MFALDTSYEFVNIDREKESTGVWSLFEPESVGEEE